MLKHLPIALSALALAACETITVPSDVQDRTPKDIGAFYDCLRERSLTIVAAHRGGDAPFENAIVTFERTVGGAPSPVALEIDVQRTRDGVLVLMHDDTLDRTTNGMGPVANVTAAQFATLRLEDDTGKPTATRPPTLRQALDWAKGRAILQLDVKRSTPIAEVIAAVRAAGASQRVIVIVYSTEAAIAAHRLAPDLMLSVPAESIPALEGLSSMRFDMRRVLAWTGTSEPNSELNVQLAQKKIEVIFGTLGDAPTSWDNRFAREGDQGYAAFADTGIQMISSGRPLEAMRALDDADGPGVPANACLSARPMLVPAS
ncbi:MAG: glycerophosphodiester phosphodiesterase family protein [Alphaproteobacteria bacterium]|nr:glycerophosphodiester phosphodiesterase family protein [Alphaproteobacteria bacterium]